MCPFLYCPRTRGYSPSHTLKKSNKEQNKMSQHSNGVSFLKQLWNISDKKPLRKAPPPNVPTDIYTVPPTNRRIPHRPHPVK